MIIQRTGMAGCACGSNGNCGCSKGMGATYTNTAADVLTGAEEYLSPSTVIPAFQAQLAATPMNWYALAGLAIVPLAAAYFLSGHHKAF